MLGKIVGKKCQKRFFIFTPISLFSNDGKGGKNSAKQLFQKHTHSASKKCWGKNRRKKVRKTFFYIHTNTVTKKWGEKKARNNFSGKTLIVRAKNVGQKIVGKK